MWQYLVDGEGNSSLETKGIEQSSEVKSTGVGRNLNMHIDITHDDHTIHPPPPPSPLPSLPLYCNVQKSEEICEWSGHQSICFSYFLGDACRRAWDRGDGEVD